MDTIQNMPTIKIHELPIEVLTVIIQKLQIEDVYNLMLTCKTLMNIIINNNTIWRLLSRTTFIMEERGKSKIAEQSWYDRCKISNNWCKARYKNRALKYHNDYYMPWLKYHNSEVLLLTIGSDLYCYSVDKYGFPNCRQYMWKVSMPKIERLRDKRTDDICRFVLRDNILVCGNRNGSSDIYRLDNIYSQPSRIQFIPNCQVGGSVEVSAVEILIKDNLYFVTGSINSPFVLFWTWEEDDHSADLEYVYLYGTARTSHSIEIDGSTVSQSTKCLAMNEVGDRLAIGPDGNSKPMLIDIPSMDYLIDSRESANKNQIVQDIQWHDENTLCYVTHSGRLQMMDIRTKHVVYDAKDPFDASFYCVKTDGSRAVVVGTSQHSRAVLYDTRQTRHAQLYFTQQKWKSSPVYSLDFDSTKLIAATARGVGALNFDVPPHTPSKDYSTINFH